MNKYRKAVAAIMAAVTTAISLDVLPESYNKYVAIVAAFLGALGVYGLRNEE